jgi:two-component system, NarL family, response regulator EvgA
VEVEVEVDSVPQLTWPRVGDDAALGSHDDGAHEHDAEAAATPPPRPHADSTTVAAPDQVRPLSVILVDDDKQLRALTRMLLTLEEHAIDVIAETDDGYEALALARVHEPDVVLLDLMMPKVDGREILSELVLRSPRTMVLVLSALSGREVATATFARGAFAYLEKSVIGPELITEIRQLHALFERALSGETIWTPAGPDRIRR